MVNIELKKWAQNKDAILRKEKAEKKRKKELEEKQAKAKRFRRKKEENILWYTANRVIMEKKVIDNSSHLLYY